MFALFAHRFANKYDARLFQGATVGVAASTLGLPFTSLTLIGPTAYLGQVNSTALTLWGRLSGPLIDNVNTFSFIVWNYLVMTSICNMNRL